MKKILTLFLCVIACYGFSQFEMNVFNQRMQHTFFNNHAQIGNGRDKRGGYAHAVTSGDHNVAAWGYMAFGRYMNASLADQQKGWHALGLSLNNRNYLTRGYNNAHLTYAYHKAFGPKGSFQKTVINIAGTGSFINSSEELQTSFSASASINVKRFSFGVTMLDLNQPISDDLIGGFGTLQKKTDYWVGLPSLRLSKKIRFYPDVFMRKVKDQKMTMNVQGILFTSKVRTYWGLGPNGGFLTGFGFSVKHKIHCGYYYNTNEFGKTHEWRVNYGISRWKKENERWD